jgi:hypothetical protein
MMMDNLNAVEHLAMRLKFEGRPYAEMADLTGIPRRTLESWFTRAGRLSEAYREFQDKMRADVNKANQDIIAEYRAIDTVTPLREIIEDKGHKDRMQAVKYLNDIARGIRPTDQHQDTTDKLKDQMTDDEIAEAMAKLLKEKEAILKGEDIE